MKVTIVKIGRVAYPQIRALAEIYRERVGGFLKIEDLELKDDEAWTKYWSQQSGAKLVALDERGPTYTSVVFAKKLQSWIDDPGVKQLVLLIGGPMGLPHEVKSSGAQVWSLSPLTVTSDLAWLLCWEQVYRALNILKGTGYHHD